MDAKETWSEQALTSASFAAYIFEVAGALSDMIRERSAKELLQFSIEATHRRG